MKRNTASDSWVDVKQAKEKENLRLKHTCIDNPIEIANILVMTFTEHMPRVQGNWLFGGIKKLVVVFVYIFSRGRVDIILVLRDHVRPELLIVPRVQEDIIINVSRGRVDIVIVSGH